MLRISKNKLKDIICEEYTRMFDPETYDVEERIYKLQRFRDAIVNSEFDTMNREEVKSWWVQEFGENPPEWI